MNRLIFPLLAILLAGGCGDGGGGETGSETTLVSTAPEVSFAPGSTAGRTAKPQGPVTISYKIIGTPIVGQPVGVDLAVQSTLGPQQIVLSYRINDDTAMQFPKEQLPRVSLALAGEGEPSLQQVRVTPLREGRLFLNVSATVENENGSVSTVAAIPIQVGGAVRNVLDNGKLMQDENGETVRSLPASEE